MKQVFIGGNFTQVNAQSRPYLAGSDIATGQLTAWNPAISTSAPQDAVQTLKIHNNVLYAGGSFDLIGGQTSRGIAAFALPPAPIIVPESVQRLANRGFQFQISSPPSLQATVQVSINLKQWTTHSTVPLTNGCATFTDMNASNFPQRFYRLRVQ
jgi:hypothetical protein